MHIPNYTHTHTHTHTTHTHTPHHLTAQSITEYNGASMCAMTGKNCVAIAADTRLGIQVRASLPACVPAIASLVLSGTQLNEWGQSKPPLSSQPQSPCILHLSLATSVMKGGAFACAVCSWAVLHLRSRSAAQTAPSMPLSGTRAFHTAHSTILLVAQVQVYSTPSCPHTTPCVHTPVTLALTHPPLTGTERRHKQCRATFRRSSEWERG